MSKTLIKMSTTKITLIIHISLARISNVNNLQQNVNSFHRRRLLLACNQETAIRVERLNKIEQRLYKINLVWLPTIVSKAPLIHKQNHHLLYSYPQNLQLVQKRNRHPIWLRRRPLQLLNLCPGSLRHNRDQSVLHRLPHPQEVPNQSLRIISHRANETGAMRRPRNRIHTDLMPLQLHHRQRWEDSN